MDSVSTLLLIATLVNISVSACFLPNGSALNDPWAQPCSPDLNNPLHTVCCHTKWKNPPGGDLKNGPSADECLPNGLCQNRGWSSVEGDKKDPWTHYYRVYCTNEDWSGCLSVCNTGLGAGDVYRLTPCDGTSTSEKWCCGASAECCASGNDSTALAIPRTLARLAPESPSPSPSVTSLKGSTSHKRHSMRIGIGAGFGVLIVVLIVAILIWWCCWKRRATERTPASFGDSLVGSIDARYSRHQVVARSGCHG